jgi:GDP-D-mannose dehydratase
MNMMKRFKIKIEYRNGKKINKKFVTDDITSMILNIVNCKQNAMFLSNVEDIDSCGTYIYPQEIVYIKYREC